MALADPTMLAARASNVRDLLREQAVDGLIVTSLPNITYLTGFRGSAAIVLLTSETLHLVTDFRYVATVEAMADAVPDLRLVRVDTSYDETLAGVIASSGLRHVGFEAAHLSVARYNWLSTALANEPPDATCRLKPIERGIERFRLRKDASEIQTLRVAARMLSAVADKLLPTVRSGLPERDVAAEIDARMHHAGFERPAFDTIVASGPNAGLPHARPGERRLQGGDLVVLDFGGVYDGYCVDLTRMVSIGPPGPEAVRWHEAVCAAQTAAIAAVRPGVQASSVDAAARGVLADQGLAEAFGHGTGHGLGLEVHEEPRISRPRAGASGDSATDPGAVTLEPGMVFTIEPGVYFPGKGGVRIEDDVLISEEGVERLTDVPRALVVNA